MMTKEEVTSIVTYCQMHKVSYSKLLKELGVPTWKFYEYKSRYASEPQVGKAEFVQITDGGTYVPAARLESTRGARSGSLAMRATNRLSIEIRLAKGTILRVQGEIDTIHLQTIIKTAANVQP